METTFLSYMNSSITSRIEFSHGIRLCCLSYLMIIIVSFICIMVYIVLFKYRPWAGMKVHHQSLNSTKSFKHPIEDRQVSEKIKERGGGEGMIFFDFFLGGGGC